MGDKTVFLLQHFHKKKERWDRSHRFWVGSIGWVSPVGLRLPRGFRVQMFRVYLGSRAPLWRRDTKIGRQDRDSEKNRGRRDSCIYIFTGVRPKKNGGGSCRRGGAHPMPWLRRGGRRGCAHPIPRLRRSAPKRHRRERTATEVAPPHSPYAAPRLTLHVSDVLEKVVCPAPYIFFIKYESYIRFASIII